MQQLQWSLGSSGVSISEMTKDGRRFYWLLYMNDLAVLEYISEIVFVKIGHHTSRQSIKHVEEVSAGVCLKIRWILQSQKLEFSASGSASIEKSGVTCTGKLSMMGSTHSPYTTPHHLI
jgi:hypothetical protein